MVITRITILVTNEIKVNKQSNNNDNETRTRFDANSGRPSRNRQAPSTGNLDKHVRHFLIMKFITCQAYPRVAGHF